MITVLSVMFTILTLHISFQETTSSSAPDPFEQKIDLLELKDETLGDALGRLNQMLDISMSVEGILPEEGTVPNAKFTASVENRTLAEVLNWLCALDSRYTWIRDGNSVNLFPRASSNDPSYFFNRVLPKLSFQHLRRADDAAVALVHQLGDPNENLIVLGTGVTEGFAEPWTASFNNITVRQALNRIAQQLGPTYGWQIGGTTKARLIVFHYKLGGQHVHLGDQYPRKQ